MRFRDLRLIRFGRFADTTLDFGPQAGGQGALHVILGANEAGKSTTLRAVRSLLFGFHPQCDDAFLYPYGLLRVGATLERECGSVQLFVRRKGNVGTLLDGDGGTLADTLLGPFLGGTDQDVYNRLNCLDHADVRRGGDNLREGRGDLAEALFSAGSGVTQLQEILRSLDAEADRLYKPGGRRSDPIIVQSVALYKDRTEKSRELAVPSTEWIRLQEQLAECQGRHSALMQELTELLRERVRYERLNRCAPKVARRREILRELADIGSVPNLPPDARDRRLEAVRQRNIEALNLRKTDEEIAESQKALDGLPVNQQFLDRKAELEDLSLRLGQHYAAMRDLPKRRAEERQIEAAALQLLRSVQPDASLDDIEKFRLPAVRRAEILRLATEHTALAVRLRSAEDELETAQEQLAALPELPDLPVVPDPSSLASKLERALQEGDVEESLEQAGWEIRKREQAFERAAARLPLWSGSAEEALALVVPSAETIALFEKGLSEIENECGATESECDRLEHELRAAESELRSLTNSGQVPTELELSEAREHRESGWGLVRAAWLESSAPEEAVAAFAGETPLADAYEAAVLRADVVSDRLRLDADRVATAANLTSRVEYLSSQLQYGREMQARREDCRIDAIRKWKKAWAESGIDPATPAEMRSWLGSLALLQREASELESAREARDKLERRSAKIGRVLSEEMEAVGKEAQCDEESVLDFLQRCRIAVSEIEAARRTRADREEKRAELTASAARRSAERDKAAKEMARWEKEWLAAIDGLGWVGRAEPSTTAGVLTQLEQVFSQARLLDEKRRQIASIEADGREFGDRVRLLCADLASDLRDAPVETAAQQLERQLRLAEDHATQRRLHEEALRRRGDERRRHEQKWREAEAEIETLLSMTGCSDLSAQEAAEERVERWRGLCATREEIEKELAEEAVGVSLQELIAEVQGADPDALLARIGEIEHQVASLEEQRSPLDQEIGALKQNLAQIDGSDGAAVAAEEAQGALAQTRTALNRYLRLRLAARILRKAIDAYRESHQARLLDRAEALFRQMTLGSFERLEVAYEASEDEKPILRAIRGDEHVSVSGMSEGTRDQLYLALRLASLEQQLDSTPEPLPFIVDDILVNFDDDRARATMEILAELAGRTQVLFFTHHSRMVDLAQHLSGRHPVCFHELPAPARRDDHLGAR